MKLIFALIFFTAGLITFADQFTDELVDACHMGDIETVRDLIKRGADINARDSSGNTPLGYAAMAGNSDIYELLIKNGADFDLFDCSAAGDLQRVKELIADKADINAINRYGSTALLLASWDKGVEVMELLLNNGANIDLQNDQGRTALMSAAKNGQKKAVELLLEYDANIHLKDSNEKTALTWAQWHKAVDRTVAEEIAGILINAGAKE